MILVSEFHCLFATCVLLIEQLLFRSGTLVSGDSSGSVQFWDVENGTSLAIITGHKGDVHALAAAPNHNMLFSAGSDGKVCSSIRDKLL